MSNKAYVDNWTSHMRANLCSTHMNNPGRISFEFAVGGLEECAKFIADYHGRDTAVGVLDRLTTSTMARTPMPPTIFPENPAAPKPDRIKFWKMTFPNTWMAGWICGLVAGSAMNLLIRHFL